jgi:hypothetical protein
VRIALLSDIHGNLTALDAVLEDMASQEPFDQVVAAGDLVWPGPWPHQVVDRLQAIGAVAIQGNTDAYLSYTPQQPPPGKLEERFAVQLGWIQQRLGPERTAYLLDLPLSHRISPAPGHDLLEYASPIRPDHPPRSGGGA